MIGPRTKSNSIKLYQVKELILDFGFFSLISYQVKELILHFWIFFNIFISGQGIHFAFLDFSNNYIHILSISHGKCVFRGPIMY